MMDKPLGRPDSYTEEAGMRICSLVSIGTSLNKICNSDEFKDEGLPSLQTVFTWFTKHETFLDNYTRAKEQSGDADQDKLDEIAEKVLSGELCEKKARVAADIIKWSATAYNRTSKYLKALHST